jgi:nitrite reductase/ring-hydroxylating ferredoxin subunit
VSVAEPEAHAPSPSSEYREEGCFEVTLVDGARVRVPRFCPHRGGRLDHGELDRARGRVVCPLHRSVFELKTGAQLAGPPCEPLAVAHGTDTSRGDIE